MFKFKLPLLIVVLLYSCIIFTDPLLVHLQPPFQDSSDFIVQAACNRPRRTGGINISLEHKNDKTLLHCYGHGGSGFTTLFGSIDKSLELLLKATISFDTPIRIIGSGCIGLTMAIELHRHGFCNVTISTKEKFDIPSWRAGGIFDPGTGLESAPGDILHLELGLLTYQTLTNIKNHDHAYLTADVVQQMPLYYPTTILLGVEILEKLNLMPHSELVTLDFGNGLVHEGYKRQETYFINITELMKQLWHVVTDLQIPVIDEEIISFDDCAESVICNCAGVGSKVLNNDENVYPARGHFFMLKKQHDQSLDYMLFTKVQMGDRQEFIYFIPKPHFVSEEGELETDGILGGTNIPCASLTQPELYDLDITEFAKLKERVQLFFHG